MTFSHFVFLYVAIFCVKSFIMTKVATTIIFKKTKCAKTNINFHFAFSVDSISSTYVVVAHIYCVYMLNNDHSPLFVIVFSRRWFCVIRAQFMFMYEIGEYVCACLCSSCGVHISACLNMCDAGRG